MFFMTAYKMRKIMKKIVLATSAILLTTKLLGEKTVSKEKGNIDAENASQISQISQSTLTSTVNSPLQSSQTFSQQLSQQSTLQQATSQQLFLQPSTQQPLKASPKNSESTANFSRLSCILDRADRTQVESSIDEKDLKSLKPSHVYGCLFRSEDKIIDTLSLLMRYMIPMNTAMKKRIVELMDSTIEKRDYFSLHYYFEVIKMYEMREAMPSIINLIKMFGVLENKRVTQRTEFYPFDEHVLETAIQTLGIFSLKEDWNAINTLIELLKSQNDEARINAVATLIFVNKHVDDGVIRTYQHENAENRLATSRKMLTFYSFELKEKKLLGKKEKEIIKERINSLMKVEKNQEINDALMDVLTSLEPIDESGNYLSDYMNDDLGDR